jgi:hypothetical protein
MSNDQYNLNLTARLLESRWTSHANGALIDVVKRTATGGPRR